VNYHELIQAYFERSTALQWYWTVYIIVIGGVLGFSIFRQRPDLVRTVLITILYMCFAYKNLGAIEATVVERQALLSVLKEYPAAGPGAADIKRVRDTVEPTLTSQEVGDVRHFHLACDLMTVAVLWVREWRRRKTETSSARAAF
jgi:hypothetical protein